MHELGPYAHGEIPLPLTVVMTDAAGAVLNLTGYTARLNITRPGGTDVVRVATIPTGVDGRVLYQWVVDDFDQPGVHRGQVWAGNGTHRFASQEIRWTVLDGPGTPPAI